MTGEYPWKLADEAFEAFLTAVQRSRIRRDRVYRDRTSRVGRPELAILRTYDAETARLLAEIHRQENDRAEANPNVTAAPVAR